MNWAALPVVLGFLLVFWIVLSLSFRIGTLEQEIRDLRRDLTRMRYLGE